MEASSPGTVTSKTQTVFHLLHSKSASLILDQQRGFGPKNELSGLFPELLISITGDCL